MATRSTVTLHPSSYRKIHLYRHWDGGPWGNGSALAKLLRRHSWASTSHYNIERAAMKFAEELIRLSDCSGRGMYELTTAADDHGDAVWHYDIFFTADGEQPAVRIKQRQWSVDDGAWFYELGGDVKMFRDYLAKYQRDMLNRMRASRPDRLETRRLKGIPKLEAANGV